MFRNPSVLGPTGTTTDDMALRLGWVLEPRKVDGIEILVTDGAVAIEACLASEVEANGAS